MNADFADFRRLKKGGACSCYSPKLSHQNQGSYGYLFIFFIRENHFNLR